MSNINPAIPAGASGAAFAHGGDSLHMRRMVAAIAEGGRVASARSAVAAPRLSDMSPDALVAAANRRLAQQTTRLEFIVRHDPAGVIVRLVDAESGDVIRQYATADVREYAVSSSFMPGSLFYDAV